MEHLAWLAAIPLLALGWHLGGMVWGQVAKRRALRRLPEVMEDLGVTSARGGHPGRFATYELDYRGRRFSVAPETRGFIHATTSAEVPWMLSTLELPGVKHGMEYFESGDAGFDSLFKSRYATHEVAERLRNDSELRTKLRTHASSDRLGAKWVQLNEQGVSLSAKEAHAMGAPSYLRADGLTERLDALGELAAVVEGFFASTYPRDA